MSFEKSSEITELCQYVLITGMRMATHSAAFAVETVSIINATLKILARQIRGH
jgi:hypothetical protein